MKITSYLRLIIYFTLVGIVVLGSKFFLINITPSLPRGIYIMSSPKNIKRGDLVVFEVPEKIKNNKYVPSMCKVMLKEVGALSNDKVEVKNKILYINNKKYGKIFEKDLSGEKLEQIEKLQPTTEEFLPLAPRWNSWDGRYWGTIELKNIRKKATLLIRF